MRKREMIKAMHEIVRDLGRNQKIFCGEKVLSSRLLRVPIALVCSDDLTTEVEITHDGHLDIMGWDGNEGCGDHAETFTHKEIETLYTYMLTMREEEPRDVFGYIIKKGDLVWWRDPETGKRSKYEVYDDPTEEMVRLWNKHGECEAYARECRIITN